MFESALRERAIPYVLSGSRSFFDAAEIKDVLCYLRVLANPDDDTALLRIINTPRRGLGAATIELLVQSASTTRHSLGAALGSVAFNSQISPRISKLAREFATWIIALQRRAEHESPAAIARVVIADVRYEIGRAHV